MTAPPIYGTCGTAAGYEGQDKDTDLSTKRSQVRWLATELGVTPAEANRLIRAYHLDQRDRDARSATREEFAAWFQRRGDILVVRSKIKRDWVVTSS